MKQFNAGGLSSCVLIAVAVCALGVVELTNAGDPEIKVNHECVTELFFDCDEFVPCGFVDQPCDHCTDDDEVSVCSGFLENVICVQFTDDNGCGVLKVGLCKETLFGLMCFVSSTGGDCERKVCAQIGA